MTANWTRKKFSPLRCLYWHSATKSYWNAPFAFWFPQYPANIIIPSIPLKSRSFSINNSKIYFRLYLRYTRLRSFNARNSLSLRTALWRNASCDKWLTDFGKCAEARNVSGKQSSQVWSTREIFVWQVSFETARNLASRHSSNMEHT